LRGLRDIPSTLRQDVGDLVMTKDAKTLLSDLAIKGGAIVSSASYTVGHLYHAQSTGRFYVDENGLGFVLESPYWLKIARMANEARTIHTASET